MSRHPPAPLCARAERVPRTTSGAGAHPQLRRKVKCITWPHTSRPSRPQRSFVTLVDEHNPHGNWAFDCTHRPVRATRAEPALANQPRKCVHKCVPYDIFEAYFHPLLLCYVCRRLHTNSLVGSIPSAVGLATALNVLCAHNPAASSSAAPAPARSHDSFPPRVPRSGALGRTC